MNLVINNSINKKYLCYLFSDKSKIPVIKKLMCIAVIPKLIMATILALVFQYYVHATFKMN